VSIPEGYIEEIRNSIKLSSIVQNKVKLIKKGKNFVGLCPFHNEKTPSFNILDDEGFYGIKLAIEDNLTTGRFLGHD